jgi:hypothetical protein
MGSKEQSDLLRLAPYCRLPNKFCHSGFDKFCYPRIEPGMAFIKLHYLRLPARVRSVGTSIANVNSVALKVTRWPGERGLRRPSQN